MAKKVIATGDYNAASFGQNGFRVVDSGGGTEANEIYVAIQVIADAVVTTTTDYGDALSSTSISAGTVVFGVFNTITVDSGTVLAYIG